MQSTLLFEQPLTAGPAPAAAPPSAAHALPPAVAAAIWHADELGHAPSKVKPSGWEALDAELPGGGWPEHAITEVLTAQPAVLEWRLLTPALRPIVAAGGQVVVVGPPRQPHLPGLLHEGLDERQLLWIQAELPSERLWVTEQLIKSNSAAAVVAWLPQARQEQLRRLQVCAQSCDGLVFLCRPESARHEASAAPLRVHAAVDIDWALKVDIFKRRGPSLQQPLQLPSVPGGLAAVLTPRLRMPSRLILSREAADVVGRPVAAPGPGNTPPPNDAQRGLATWALQFSPRVAVVDDAVVVELAASTRLFGGRRKLRDRVVAEGTDLGVTAVAWAPTGLAALALARAGKEDGIRRPLADILDGLPIGTLTAVAPHRTTLTQLGCRTLGDLRALPRGGIARRFDQRLLTALDQAYGLRPEAHAWHTLPDAFKARIELMARVETAPALLSGARRLLLQLCGWLAARHAGTTTFALRWAHDTLRSRDAGAGGELVVRTAVPMRDVEHLCRLLAENLAKVQLLAPVGDLELEALDVQLLDERSASLLPDAAQSGESLTLVLERIAARLGAARVLRPLLVEDHRLEWMQHWQPAPLALPRKRPRRSRVPQPTFVLPQPLRLALRGERPMYQGPLHLLTGPHRVESGWWHRVGDGDGAETRNVVRDYWVALSDHCGVLWIFQERLAGEETAWYLQGSFA